MNVVHEVYVCHARVVSMSQNARKLSVQLAIRMDVKGIILKRLVCVLGVVIRCGTLLGCGDRDARAVVLRSP